MVALTDLKLVRVKLFNAIIMCINMMMLNAIPCHKWESKIISGQSYFPSLTISCHCTNNYDLVMTLEECSIHFLIKLVFNSFIKHCHLLSPLIYYFDRERGGVEQLAIIMLLSKNPFMNETIMVNMYITLNRWKILI